jgi:peptide/nickel transport system permease protein
MTDQLLVSGEAEAPGQPHFLSAVFKQPVAVACLIYLVILIGACVLAGTLTSYSPTEQDLTKIYQGPSGAHLLGTDALGRDILTRLLYGGRITLSGALLAVVVFASIGVVVGVLSGSVGGRLDALIMRITEILQSIPALIVLLVVLAIFGSSEVAAMTALGVLSSPGLIRVVRGATLTVKEELYVRAARVAGLTAFQIQRRHILPAVAGPTITQVTLFAAVAILTEAGIGYLGLGVQEPTANWGNMVNNAQAAMAESPWMLVPTGGALVLTSLALGLLGNVLRDAYSGRSTRGGSQDQSWRSMSAGAELVAPASSEPLAAQVSTRPLLSVQNLSVRIGDSRTLIVDDVSFDLDAGASVGIVGESGCGKTMAVTALLRVTPPGSVVSASSCMFDGAELSNLGEAEINKVRGSGIAYISQEPISSLDPVFTAGDQIAEAVRHHRGVGRKEARAIALELFDQVRLPDPSLIADKYPHELSGGQAQRVAIARALAGRPKLLIADEPTTALDVTIQADILDLLRDIREQTGMALIIVTHDWGVLADSCDRAIVMYAGQIVEDAPIEDLVRRPRHPYANALQRSNPAEAEIGKPLPTIPGMVPAPGNWPVGCRFADRCELATAECRAEPIELTRRLPHHDVRCIHTDELVEAMDR